jgi:hypothetical protein
MYDEEESLLLHLGKVLLLLMNKEVMIQKPKIASGFLVGSFHERS